MEKLKEYFTKDRLPTTLLIISGFAALAVLPILFLILNSSIWSMTNPDQKTRYQFKNTRKDDLKSPDPLMTRVPQLKDIMAGPILSDTAPSMGNHDAPINIVEFSDFQCTYCREQDKDIMKLVKEYENKVRFIWKNYPDTDVNSLSFQAAAAAMCAHEQARFWPFHDLLFERQGSLSKEIFMDIAKNLKLDINSFEACLGDTKVKEQISDNIKEADTLEITGIPFIYVNDQEMMGRTTYQDLKDMVERVLKKKAK